ncbi:DJ-1/PfpI family protein [Variovorax ginsengisoli]|uniref:DJ-1/PfpI family protein n=1 Tax=Variovorax ginsengisoli TaxID=363844 RepID=A0ABT8SFW7_9BURK|nr:DJ-1/PfpI family protein [Variovorax ginsengisoli]MDN8618088.1 DJ-1/PfpI family protein [Variovorax ginsengisoli]MDO1537258.1 DJ-1/PfpI family protein [Variovorax ginsengisoli]
MQESEPPFALLGGLNVALLAAPGSDAEALAAMRRGLEAQGVIVYVLSPGPPGTQPLPADRRIADADPMAFDGVVVVGGAEGVAHLRAAPESLQFIRGINRDGKPLGALGEGVLLLLDTGLAAGRQLCAAEGVAGELWRSRARRAHEPVCAQERWVTATGREALDAFEAAFRKLLEERRRESLASEADATPSSAGEDG